LFRTDSDHVKEMKGRAEKIQISGLPEKTGIDPEWHP